jgi:HlyD family secretion protein
MSKIKQKKTNWLLWVLLGLFAIGLTYAIINARSKPKGTEITTTKVEKRTIKEKVSASGKIYPEKEVKISSDVSGEIVALYVKEGDSVRVGQILAKVDPEVYISSVDRGEAALSNSKSMLAVSKSQIESSAAQKEQIMAQLDNTRAVHKRNEQLKKEGVISQADLDMSLSNLRQLEANLKASDASIKSAQKNVEAAEYSLKGSSASLKELKTNLNKTIIKSPTNGIISKLDVEKGERVVGTIQMTGTEMMRISNLNAMEVQVDVSENDILKVSVGDEVDIEVDAYVGKKLKGIVSEIANSAKNVGSSAQATSDQVTNFVVKVRVLESSYKGFDTKYPLRPGMSASVDIYTESVIDVVAVPIQCVAAREQETDKKQDEKIEKKDDMNERQDEEEVATQTIEFDEVVFVMKGDTASMVKVVTGIQDDEYIQIKSGLKGDEILVAGPYTEVSKNLKSGDKIRVKEEKKSKDN